LLVALRRILADGQGPIPWAKGKQAGSVRHLFVSAASLLRTATPTLGAPFVKPIGPEICIYAAELLHLLCNQISIAPAFRLQDDAARAIYNLRVPDCTPVLPLELAPEERETLVSEFVTTLVDLNLTLPPDPEAKHEPVTVGHSGDASGQGGDDIVLGWDRALSRLTADGGIDDDDVTEVGFSAASSSRQQQQSSAAAAPGAAAAIPGEVARLLVQSPECLRWNAALALYTLGVDLSVVCQDGFTRSLEKWRKRREQARILIAGDLLRRASIVANRPVGAPRSLGDV